MSFIEMGSSFEAEEELGPIGVGTSVGHRKDPSFSMFADCHVLVCKLITINTLSSCAVSNREVTSLCHESSNNSVELGSFVVEWFA